MNIETQATIEWFQNDTWTDLREILATLDSDFIFKQIAQEILASTLQGSIIKAFEKEKIDRNESVWERLKQVDWLEVAKHLYP